MYPAVTVISSRTINSSAITGAAVSNKKVDSLIITWPNSRQTKLFDVKANQLLKVNSNNSKNYNSKSNPKELFFEEIPTKINYTHIENYFDDYEKQVLLPHKLSQLGPALAVADVNGDNLDDVYIGSASGKVSKLLIQNNQGELLESESKTWDPHKVLEDIDAVFLDFDNDGDNDLYVVSGGNEFSPNSSTYLDRIYINDGKGNFEFKRNLLPDVYESGSVVRPYDFDNDGDLDLVLNNMDAVASVYKNKSEERSSGNLIAINLKGPKSNPFALGAKISIPFENKTIYHFVCGNLCYRCVC